MRRFNSADFLPSVKSEKELELTAAEGALATRPGKTIVITKTVVLAASIFS